MGKTEEEMVCLEQKEPKSRKESEPSIGSRWDTDGFLPMVGLTRSVH